MDTTPKVKLKWTSLVLIALIVALFGNFGSPNLQPRLHQLQQSVDQLHRKLGLLEYKLEQQARTILSTDRSSDTSHMPHE